MKKSLVISVVEDTGLDWFYIRIVNQSSRGSSFGNTTLPSYEWYGPNRSFLAANGVKLMSIVEPEVCVEQNMFFVRGNDTELDNSNLRVPCDARGADYIARLRAAVDEYNRFEFPDTVVSVADSIEPLFEQFGCQGDNVRKLLELLGVYKKGQPLSLKPFAAK